MTGIPNYGISKRKEVSILELKLVRNSETVGALMKKYLERFGVKSRGKEKEFCEKYWESLISKVVDDCERVVLPHNLGYIQVLEHKYNGHKKEHFMKFGILNYSLVWMKHPMFQYHKINASKKLKERIRANVLKGKKYLNDFVDGDFYVNQ